MISGNPVKYHMIATCGGVHQIFLILLGYLKSGTPGISHAQNRTNSMANGMELEYSLSASLWLCVGRMKCRRVTLASTWVSVK